MTNQLTKLKEFSHSTRKEVLGISQKKSLRKIALDAKIYEKYNGGAKIDSAFEKSLDKAQNIETTRKNTEKIEKKSDVKARKIIDTKKDDDIKEKTEKNIAISKESSCVSEKVYDKSKSNAENEINEKKSQEVFEQDEKRKPKCADTSETMFLSFIAPVLAKEVEQTSLKNTDENLEQLLPKTKASEKINIKNTTLLSMLSGTLFSEEMVEKTITPIVNPLNDADMQENTPKETIAPMNLEGKVLTKNNSSNQLLLHENTFKILQNGKNQSIPVHFVQELLKDTSFASAHTATDEQVVPSLEGLAASETIKSDFTLQNAKDFRPIIASTSATPLIQTSTIPKDNELLGFTPSLLNALRGTLKISTNEIKSQKDTDELQSGDAIGKLFEDIHLNITTKNAESKGGENFESAFLGQSVKESLLNFQALATSKTLVSSITEETIPASLEALNVENKSSVQQETDTNLSPILLNAEQKITEVTEAVQKTNAKKDYEVTKQIIEQVKILKNNQNSEMLIRLKPAHLGELSLRIALRTDGTVSAVFHTNNAETRGILETSMLELKQELQKVGLKVDSIDISAGLTGDTFLGSGAGESSSDTYQERQAQFTNISKNMQTLSDDLEVLEPKTNEQGTKVSTTENGVDYLV